MNWGWNVRSIAGSPAVLIQRGWLFFFWSCCLWEVVDFLMAESSNWNCFPNRKKKQKTPPYLGLLSVLREHLAHAWRRTASSFCLTLVSLRTWSLKGVVLGYRRFSWLFFSRKNAKFVQCNVLLSCKLIIFAFPTNGTTAQHPKGSWHLVDVFWAQAEWICNEESRAQLFGIKKAADSFSSVNRSSSCAN